MKPKNGIFKEKYDDAIFHKEQAHKRSEDLKNSINKWNEINETEK